MRGNMRAKLEQAKWWVDKLIRTFKLCHNIFMARMTGEYVHSCWDPRQGSMLVYKWKGVRWYIPNPDPNPDETEPNEEV